MRRPVWTTILMGLGFGLALTPAALALDLFLPRFDAFYLAVFGLVAVWAWFLARLNGKDVLSLFFPLLLLLIPAVWGRSMAAFLLTAVGVGAWARTGLASGPVTSARLGVELLLSVGGAALVAMMAPHTLAHWSVGVWLFFLIQSLYWVLLPPPSPPAHEPVADPFERARKKAEDILESELY